MIHNKLWRLNNLYRIVDKNGSSVPFKLNDVQKVVALDKHKRKLILKARQLGMSTYAVLDLLDDVLFNENLAGGIVSYSLEHAQHIFKRIIGHALDTMLPELKPLVGIVTQSAREITFTNGSFLRVDTSLRGGSYQSILVSEFGKTCARSPQKAEEVITGTLQTVGINGKIVIESTGEGNSGYFAEMVQNAVIRGNDNLSDLEYCLYFFSWNKEKAYRTSQEISYDIELTDYFDKLEKELDITIDQQQRYWYAQQKKVLGEKITQEFPSTPQEAFLSNSDAYYYATYIEAAYNSNRCLHTSLYDALLPVYVAMDIGVNDLTVMIFFQIAHGEIRIIDYYEDNNKGVDFYAHFLLQDKKYLYNTIYLPHDSKQRSKIDAGNTYERDFRRLFSGVNTKFHVLERSDVNLGISHAKLKFERCVFAINRVKPLIEHLGKYRKKWSQAQGRYLDEPMPSSCDHAADAFRYLCMAVTKIETVSTMNGALEKHRQAVDMRRTLM